MAESQAECLTTAMCSLSPSALLKGKLDDQVVASKVVMDVATAASTLYATVFLWFTFGKPSSLKWVQLVAHPLKHVFQQPGEKLVCF